MKPDVGTRTARVGTAEKRSDGRRPLPDGHPSAGKSPAGKRGKAAGARFTGARAAGQAVDPRGAARSAGGRSVGAADALRAETHKTRVWGYSLIGAGSLGLLLTLMFSGLPAFSAVPERLSKMFSGMGARFRHWIYGPEKVPSPWDFSDIEPLDELKAVPSARGWSALDSFYATHPNVEGEEEYYLDPALWREVITAKPNASGGAVTVPAGISGDSASMAAGQTLRPDAADSTAAPAPSRRSMGLWTGPADGTLVDTSIRPAREQLRRQGVMALQAPADSLLDGAANADSVAPTDGPKPQTDAMASAGTAGETAPVATAAGEIGKPTSEKALHVEFWESPVHYKGYQLNGNNLILYGINDADSLRFENHPDGVWMYHKTAVYRLTASAEMQRFELISGTDSLGEPAEDASEEMSGDPATAK